MKRIIYITSLSILLLSGTLSFLSCVTSSPERRETRQGTRVEERTEERMERRR